MLTLLHNRPADHKGRHYNKKGRHYGSGRPVHSVEILAGTRLSVIVGEPLTMTVNSRHHQAIKRPGDSLVVSARDPEDGTIEGVERPDKRFVVGVQWHPEDQAARDERQANLFLAFAAVL